MGAFSYATAVYWPLVLLQFFTLANTYICVVSQFAISVENTKANFSEDPFQLMLDDE